MMQECISIHIGQAGVSLGNSCWELYCLEHGIQPDGQRIRMTTTEEEDNYSFRTFFSETSSGKFIPRALFIDLEPTLIDEVRSGRYGELYNHQLFVSGRELDTGNNFARGYYTLGTKIIDRCMNRIRFLAEDCENLSGFVIFNAVAGGTGSGFCSLLLEQLSIEFAGNTKIAFTIYPTSSCDGHEVSPTSVVEPYNSILASRSLVEYTDAVVLFDNVSVYDICRRSLHVERPVYANLNRLVSQAISSMTASMRFEDTPFNKSLLAFSRSAKADFGRLRFLVPSYAPILSTKKVNHEQSSFIEITNTVFEPESYMIKCDPSFGKYFGLFTFYRGEDLDFKDVKDAVSKVKNNIVSVFNNDEDVHRSGINHVPVTVYPGGDLATVQREVCVISNTTSIREIFSPTKHKFSLMYIKRAFLHWYFCEGMEEHEFDQAYEEIASLNEICFAYENN